MPKSWYSVKNMGGGVVNLSIHNEIGIWGVDASEFLAEIADRSIVKIKLSINSPGGSFIHGLAMYHGLVNHPARVEGEVLALAGSAASLVLMACDHVVMPENTYIYAHEPVGSAGGYIADIEKTVDVMRQFREDIVDIYQRRTGLGRDEVAELMAAESMINAADSVRMGFADEMTNAIEVAALAPDFAKHFKNLPPDLAGGRSVDDVDLSSIETVRDFEKTLREVGLSKGLAQALTSRAKTGFLGDPGSEDIANQLQVAFGGLQFSVNT